MVKPPQRGGIVLIEDGRVALIKRVNERGEYYLFPGGGVEEGETPEQTAVREALEELGLEVRLLGLLGVVEHKGREQFYYAVERIGGEFGTGTGEELSSAPDSKAGTYEPVWIAVNELHQYNVRPPELARRVAAGLPTAYDDSWRVTE